MAVRPLRLVVVVVVWVVVGVVWVGERRGFVGELLLLP